MAESLPKRMAFVYALGQLGWSLLFGLNSTWLTFFYNPTDISGIPVLIPQIALFGFLTVLGIISMAGRVVDAITDPWIATLSDRSKHPKGRRISFMRFAAIPAGLSMALVFVSPVQGVSGWNVLFLTLMLLLFYLFYTAYVTPYFTLIAEFGHTPEEKLDLSTYISLTWFLGFAISTMASFIWPVFEGMGMDKVSAMRLTFGVLSLIGTVFMLLPAFLIDEKKYSQASPSPVPMIESLKSVLSNRWFRPFIISDFFYWFGITTWQTGTIYYVTILLLRSEQDASFLTVLAGVLSFLTYPAVNLIAKKIGKKTLMIIGYGIFICSYIITSMLGLLPLSGAFQYYLLVPLLGLPLAIFGILPNAIIADVAEFDAHKSGVYREGMFFGSRTFVQKLGQAVALLLFNSLLLLGKTSANSLGIRMTAVTAAVLMTLSLVVFLRYREREILRRDADVSASPDGD